MMLEGKFYNILFIICFYSKSINVFFFLIYLCGVFFFLYMQNRDLLKICSRHQTLTPWTPTLPDVREMAATSRLVHLQTCLFQQHQHSALLSAFVERWQLDINASHIPFSEMVIILHDVKLILGPSTYDTVVDIEHTRE